MVFSVCGAYAMAYRMFSEEKLSQAGQKTTKYWYNIFLVKHMVFNIKESISKLPIDKKTERERPVLTESLSFKTSVTKIFNFTPDNGVHCKAVFVGHNSIFCRTLSDVHC